MAQRDDQHPPVPPPPSGGRLTTGRQGVIAVAVVIGVTVLGLLWVFVGIGGSVVRPADGGREVAPLPGESGAPGEAPTLPPSEAPSQPSDSSEPSDGGSSTAPAGSVTTLDGAAPAGRCRPPSTDALAQQQVAVDAVVEDPGTDVQEQPGGGFVVTLTPTRFYAGDPTETVQVEAPDDDVLPLLGAADLTDGGRFLVAGTRGALAVCGLSGPWSPRLERLYEQAFG